MTRTYNVGIWTNSIEIDTYIVDYLHLIRKKNVNSMLCILKSSYEILFSKTNSYFPSLCKNDFNNFLQFILGQG